MSRRGGASALLAVGLLVAIARAEPRDPARADALFRDGREAMRQRDFEVACARFAESQSLDPAPGTLLNLADCEEKLGRLVTASKHVQAALAELPPRDDRARIARERLATLGRRVASVTLRLAPGTPPSGRITRDGVDVTPAELGVPERTDPGNHVYAIVLSDGREHRVTAVLREGEQREIVLDVAPPPPPPAPPPSHTPPAIVSAAPALASSSPPPPSRPTPRDRTGAYVAGGIGLVGVAIASVTGVVLLRKKATVDGACDRDARTCTSDDGVDAAHSGRTLVPIFYGAAILGVAGLATGAVLLWSHGDSGDVALSGSPAGLSLTGKFR